jgi:FMN-dependent oxidoreductase (nitrilotriacetate monooxygenase family)
MPMTAQRQLHLNVNVLATGRHNAAWRHPSVSKSVSDIGHFIEIAQTAERGTFDAIFFADHQALDESAAYRPWHSLDPAILIAAISQATTHIGLVATSSTTVDQPYHVARKVATLDHVSHGRVAWNFVTSQQDSIAQNFGYERLPLHADRYRRANEFVDVVVKLWDSWDDDAVVADTQTGQYVDFARVRPIEHRGEFFSVRGALNLPRPPQGRPVLIHAGDSGDSRAIGARFADGIFTVQRTYEEARVFYEDLKSRARGFGRRDGGPLILPGLYPVVAATEAEALARKAEFDALLDTADELAKLAARYAYPTAKLDLDKPFPDDILSNVGTAATNRGFLENLVRESRRENLTVRQVLGRNPLGGHRLIVGGPEQIADEIQHWFENHAADGFNLNFDAYPSGLALFVDHVVPVLRRRGLFRTSYTGTTLRDHLGLERPANRIRAGGADGLLAAAN